jgi:V/A-type H+-transporting ATPase subunit D
MRLRVNPTRMELLRLRRRVALARRGHKLLKDKLDGLVQRFFGLKNGFLALHNKMEPGLAAIFLKTVMASALSEPAAFAAAAAPVSIRRSTQNIMGVKIPQYDLQTAGKPVYNDLLASVEQKEALDAFRAALPELVKLAGLGQALRLIAVQIGETRRRVNALEYVLIPELERNARVIMLKLAEQERSTRVVLLKLSKEAK